MQIVRCDSKQELGRQAAQRGADVIRRAIADRGAANIIVATGASQFEMFSELIRQDINWSRVTGFHLDEYIGIPIAHGASFRKYLWERFISKLPLPLRAFHFVDGETGNPQAECDRIGRHIANHPIDVAFAGIGENAHLAFNDPPADFETDEPYIVVELDEACRRQQLGEGWFKTLQDVPKRAISMSCRQIMKSQNIVLSVPDRRKAEAVKAAVEGPVTPQVPASILQQHERTWIYLDPDSASLLKK